MKKNLLLCAILTIFNSNLVSFKSLEANLIKVQFKGDTYKIQVSPNTTVDQVRQITIVAYLASKNIQVSTENIMDLIDRSILYVYKLGEPYHHPTATLNIGNLTNYKKLRYLLHIPS